jgi:polysaccharide biosynthesis/export protein
MAPSRIAARVCSVLLAALVVALSPRAAVAEPTAEVPAVPAAAAVDTGYLVQPGDTLSITVWKEQDLQGDILVRPDGGLTFPLAGEIEAAGHTVADIRKSLLARLAKYVPDPVVTVVVKKTDGSRIFVVGKVNRPGDFPLIRPIDVMQALSLAGGTTPYADVNSIRVLRREGASQQVFRFRYDDIRRGKDLSQNMLLRSGDTVIVP